MILNILILKVSISINNEHKKIKLMWNLENLMLNRKFFSWFSKMKIIANLTTKNEIGNINNISCL